MAVDDIYQSPYNGRVPHQFLQPPESGQTRDKTSRSRTNVYHPPLSAEAFSNSKDVESDKIASSGMSTGARDSTAMHDEKVVGASE